MYGNWDNDSKKQDTIELISWKKYSFGLFFLVIGVFFIFLPPLVEGYSYIYPLLINNTNQVKTQIKPHVVKKTSPPTRIIIPSIGINLPITEAKIVHGYWEISDTTANHGIGSSNPGEKGNVVIFAHARAGLFLPLKEVKKNDNIYVYIKNKKYTYKVEQINFVTPDKIEYISQTKDTRLTLFTCSGLFDEKRMIVEAKPVRG